MNHEDEKRRTAEYRTAEQQNDEVQSRIPGFELLRFCGSLFDILRFAVSSVGH
jgi:hypothetical protein